MTKRSLIHPTLKTALGSLDLEIEAEIERYQGQKTRKITQNSSLQPPDPPQTPQLWENPVTITIDTESPTHPIDVFKTPLGLASVFLTAIASGLLGATISQPPKPQPEYLSTPPAVKGLNLAQDQIELNLQTLTTIPNPKPRQFPHSPLATSEKPQPSQLVNKLLPNLQQD